MPSGWSTACAPGCSERDTMHVVQVSNEQAVAQRQLARERGELQKERERECERLALVQRQLQIPENLFTSAPLTQ